MSAKLARGILPALCTPFDDNGTDVAEERVAPLVRHLLDAGANGFFACGGTGEGAAMNPDERRRMATATAAEIAGEVPLILQVGATSTDNAVELARHATTLQVDAVASVAPIDAPNDLDAAVAHYSAIGAATDLPFYVYWLSRTADQSVTAEQYLDAMAKVPNFAGFKFTDTNFYLFQRLVDVSGGQLNAISGPDEMCLAGLVMGADGAIGSTYNIMPRLYLELYGHFQAGRIRQAMALQGQANRVISLLMQVGVLSGIKAMLDWRGLPVGPARPPAEPLTPEQETQLRHGLHAFDFTVA
ncbi:MAG: hypothetical protein GKR89_20340 [Candidatus Latescibacteria bacterium]|nr:hypothetical protein [Candidatus Latescibacterota bacterium]